MREAKLFVGTSITRLDIAGTGVIILGVCGVVGFGNLRISTQEDIESNLDLETLKMLWSRRSWIVYFTCLEVVSILAFWLSSIIDSVWTEKQELESKADPSERLGRAPLRQEETFLQGWNRRRHAVRFRVKRLFENWSVSRPDIVIRKLSGVAWAVSGGLLAGQTLIFAKSAVKLVTSVTSEHAVGSQLASPLSMFIILLLIVAAVVQIYCLNKGELSSVSY